MMKCAACSKFMTRVDGIACPKCGSQYHHACVGMPAGSSAPRDWRCPACKRYQPRDNKADTPVKGLVQAAAAAASAPVPAGSGAVVSPRGDARDASAPPPPEEPEDAESGLRRELRLFREDLQLVRKELKDFRQEFLDIRASLADFNRKIDSLDSRIDVIESQVASSAVSAAHRVLEEAVATLQSQLNARDQELLGNDVQVSNVPEEPGESAAGLAVRICAKVGVKLDEHDVVLAYRAGKRREDGRPRLLVLRLARRAVRDDVLRSARVRRGLTTAELGLAAKPRPFYLNERLTNTNRQLFQRAREAGRAAGWRFVWTRDGGIFARRGDGQTCHRLRQPQDLEIFN